MLTKVGISNLRRTDLFIYFFYINRHRFLSVLKFIIEIKHAKLFQLVIDVEKS
jgi:hypothetical protein